MTIKGSIITVFSVVVVLNLVAVSQATDVVYQSDFTGTTLADAGLVKSTGAAGGSWIIDDPNDLLIGQGGGNARSNVTTIDSWQNDLGLTLEVTFRTTAAMTRFSFGLVDAAYTISGSGDWLNSSLSGAYGIGFSTAGSGPSDYLGFNNDAGTATVLSTAQGDATVGTGWQTMVILVTRTSWSYSLNGAPATTGSHTFDTSRNYVFTSHAQRNPRAQFSNITLRQLAWDGDDTGGDQTWTDGDTNSWSTATYNNGDDAKFLGDGLGTVTLSGTIDPGSVTVNSADDYTFSGAAITGTGPLTKDGTGTLTINTANTYTGNTTISDGTLEIGGAGTLGSGSYAGTIANSGILEFNSSATQTLHGAISGTGALVKNGTGRLNLSVNNFFTGGVTVNDGIVGLQNGAIGNNGPLTVNGGYVNVSAHDGFDNLTVSELSGTGGLIAVGRRTFTVNQSTDTTYAGIIQNQNGVGGNSPTGLRKQGIGTLTLSGLNTYNGSTTIQGGTLEVTGALFNGGTRNAITISAGTLGVTGAGYLGPGAVYDKNIASSGTFDYNSTTDQALSGVISGTGTLTKDNTSTLTLSGANTYTGNTTLTAGTLRIDGNGALHAAGGFYDGNISIASGATFQYSSSASNTDARYNGAISGDGTLIKDSSTSDLAPASARPAVASLEITEGARFAAATDVNRRGRRCGHNGLFPGRHQSGTARMPSFLVLRRSSVHSYDQGRHCSCGRAPVGTKTLQNSIDWCRYRIETTAITLNDECDHRR